MNPSSPAIAALRAGLPVLALFSAACGEPLPELRYETEHLRIGTTFDAPLCRGDLDHYERVVTTLEARLDTTVDVPIEVYIWGPQEHGSDLGWCDDYATGCFRDGVVYTDQGSIEHELVHAVIATFGAPEPFWNEGAAEALQSHRTQPGDTTPLDNLDLAPPQLSYLSAGHFSRWLWEVYGADPFRDLLREPGSARDAFERTYGLSFEAAQAQYFDEAPYSYGALIACNYPDLEQTEDQLWSETIDVDCEQSSVRSNPLGMGAYRVLTIPERGFYVLSTSAELGSISRCDDEILEEDPTAEDTWGDVPPLKEGILNRYVHGLNLDAGVTTLDLAPGRYEIAVGFSTHNPRSVQLDVGLASGP